MGWPGLAREVEEICNEIGVPNANVNMLTKNSISLALRNHDKTEMFEKLAKGYKKLDNIKGDDPTKPKEYMERKSLIDISLE